MSVFVFLFFSKGFLRGVEFFVHISDSTRLALYGPGAGAVGRAGGRARASGIRGEQHPPRHFRAGPHELHAQRARAAGGAVGRDEAADDLAHAPEHQRRHGRP